MTHFILGFTVYTLGAVGLLVLGYVGVKYFLNVSAIKDNTASRAFLKVEQAIPLETRKGIYIVKAGNQRFLVATTTENVCFLSELNRDNVMPIETIQNNPPQYMHPDLESKLKYINFIKDAINKDQVKR